MTTVVADCDWDWTGTGVGLTGITLLYFTLTSRWLAGVGACWAWVCRSCWLRGEGRERKDGGLSG